MQEKAGEIKDKNTHQITDVYFFIQIYTWQVGQNLVYSLFSSGASKKLLYLSLFSILEKSVSFF